MRLNTPLTYRDILQPGESSLPPETLPDRASIIDLQEHLLRREQS